jgi:uncharacterized protein
MLFAVICRDKENQLEKRLETRPAHVAFLNGLGERLKAAGPFLDENNNPNGSLLVISGETRQEVEALTQKDPYVTAGLFKSVEILPWNWVMKNPENAT